MRVAVGDSRMSVRMHLTQKKPILLQGPWGNGYIGVGEVSGGNAWLYYSMPRLSVDANISLPDGTELSLSEGLGWMVTLSARMHAHS